MADSPDYGTLVRTSIGQLFRADFNVDVAAELQVHSVSAQVAQLGLQKRWTLETEIEHQQLTGNYSGNNYSSAGACMTAVRAHCGAITAGAHDGFLQQLEQFVAQDPISTLWVGSVNLGRDDKIFQHVATCSSCGGAGQNACSSCQGQGSCSCSFCNTSGRQSCYSCGGSGSRWEGQRQVSCGTCGSSGHIHCNHCFGSGRTNCQSCGSTGRQSCGSCDATGYLTDRYTIQVRGQGQLSAEWQASLDDWVKRYLREALNQQVSWAPLSRSCQPDIASLRRDQTPYPICYDIRASLPYVSAELELRKHQAPGWLVGESCQPYNLDGLGDAVFTPLVDGLRKPDDRSAIGAALENRAANQLLEYRHKPDNLQTSRLCRAGIIGSALCERFLGGYQALKKQYVQRRSQHPIRDWVWKALKYAMLFLVLAGTLDAVYGNSVRWEESGLNQFVLYGHFYFSYLLETTRFIWWKGLFGPSIVYALLIIGFYVLCRMLLLSRRRVSKKRLLAGLVVSNIVVVSTMFLLSPVLTTLFEMKPVLPSVSSLVVGLLNALILLPEAILAGLLIALLRLRLRGDKKLKNFIGTIDCAPLKQDLGY